MAAPEGQRTTLGELALLFLKLGTIATALNYRLAGAELAGLTAVADPTVLVVESRYAHHVDDLRAERDATVARLREQGLEVADSDANFVLFGRFADRHDVVLVGYRPGVHVVVGPSAPSLNASRFLVATAAVSNLPSGSAALSFFTNGSYVSVTASPSMSTSMPSSS